MIAKTIYSINESSEVCITVIWTETNNNRNAVIIRGIWKSIPLFALYKVNKIPIIIKNNPKTICKVRDNSVK